MHGGKLLLNKKYPQENDRNSGVWTTHTVVYACLSLL